jgi:hypothetical protein
MRWTGHVASIGEERKAYMVLVEKPEGKRKLGIPRRRWENGNRMDLGETGCRSVDWLRVGTSGGLL